MDGLAKSGKLCTRCKKVKARAAFSIRRAAKDGLQDWCKACRKQAYGKSKGTGVVGKFVQKEAGVGYESWAIITDERRASYKAKEACYTV